MTFSFTLILKPPIVDITDDQAEKLFDEGSDDCTPGVSNGVAEISFDREAGSWKEAVESAMESVKKVFPGASIEIRKERG
jgi:hypothetical protein